VITKATDDLIKDLSKIAGEIIAIFGLMCLRAWLLSICAGLLLPAVSLGFWQWFLVSLTIRLLVVPTKAK
jgi:hypothetical protein